MISPVKKFRTDIPSISNLFDIENGEKKSPYFKHHGMKCMMLVAVRDQPKT